MALGTGRGLMLFATSTRSLLMCIRARRNPRPMAACPCRMEATPPAGASARTGSQQPGEGKRHDTCRAWRPAGAAVDTAITPCPTIRCIQYSPPRQPRALLLRPCGVHRTYPQLVAVAA